jgi:hypothetical protein
MPPNPNAAEALLAAASASPDTWPHKLDLARRCLLLVGLTPAAYRSASFLDDRLLTPGLAGGWLPVARVDEATRTVATPRPLHLILHTGHVGSTLLSRLLDELGGTLGLREPLPLRTLAEAADGLAGRDSLVSVEEFNALVALCLRLWSRGYADTRQCVLKATSSACRVAPQLLERTPGMRAAYLNLRAEAYLATLLAGENSLGDLRGHGQERYRRLLAADARPPAPLHAMSPGELAALGWLAESLTRHEVATRFPGQALLLDFDALLADVPGQLGRVARHFGIRHEPRQLEAAAASDTLRRYSKAPEFEYGPALRSQILAQARAQHASEIRAGLRWIEALAGPRPLLQAAVENSGL